MKTLYLIRHTKPQITPGTCYGQLDIEVSDSFAGEAAEVLNWLPSVDLIITSPLRRTRRLAEHLALARQCELRSDQRLMEMHFGDWEGKRWDAIPRQEIDAWSADTLDFAPRNGESAGQMMQRVRDALRDVAQLPQRHIGLVGHAGSIRALLALLGDVPLGDTLRWQIEFGAVIGIRVD